MTRQSSESIQTTERDRAAGEASGAVGEQESSIASAMRDLRKAGGWRSHAGFIQDFLNVSLVELHPAGTTPVALRR